MSNDQTYHPQCIRCLEQGIETLATLQRWGEDVCERCEDRANEQAHAAHLSSYYGGSGASDGSITEFCARALADKQGSR
jgi:hypothetical protein